MPFLKYNYDNFRAECIKLFEIPDLTQTYLSELAELAQGPNEDYETYHDRVRDLVGKAQPDLICESKERMMVNYFTKGLRRSDPRCNIGDPRHYRGRGVTSSVVDGCQPSERL